MNLQHFKEALIFSLKKSNEASISALIGSHPQLKHQSAVEFEKLLAIVKRKAHKIMAFVQNGKCKKPIIITATTLNFIYTYKINIDLSSEFAVNLIQKYNRVYPPDFLTSKIKTFEKQGFVYFLKSEYGIKIGYSKKLNERLNLFNVKLPFKTELHSFVKTSRYTEIEKILHDCLSHKRINGEWFDLSSEDFTEIDTILKNLYTERLTDLYVI